MTRPPRLQVAVSTPTRPWPERGLCYQTFDPRFFPEIGRRQADASHAKSICADCPVQAECVDYAVTTRQQNGIWGGTTERERRQIRRKRSVA